MERALLKPGRWAREFFANPRFPLPLLAVLLAARELYWSATTYLNIDEFENLQVNWFLHRGAWPGREYVHSHLPVFNLLIDPLYRLSGPVAELPERMRLSLFPFVLVTVALVAWIAREIDRRRSVGSLAVILFLASPVIGQKLVETRADIVALPLLLGAVVVFLRYVRAERHRPGLMALMGAMLGVSLALSQKGVFLTAAAALCFERYQFHVLRVDALRRWGRMAVLGILVAAPTILAFAALLGAGLLSAADAGHMMNGGSFRLRNEVMAQVQWGVLRTALPSLAAPIVVGMAGAAGCRFWSGRAITTQNAGLQLAAWAALLGLIQNGLQLVMPYHMFILPMAMVAVLASVALAGRSSALVYAVIVASMLMPLWFLRGTEIETGSRRGRQIDAFREVLRTVPPDCPVLDAYSGLGTFHPIVDRYLYYRPDILVGLDEEGARVTRLLAESRIGAVTGMSALRPYMPPAAVAALEANYQPSIRHPMIEFPREPLKPGDCAAAP